MDDYNLRKALGILKTLNHKLRRQILELINRNGKIMVGDIYNGLEIDQPVASAHLAILREADIVFTEREGQHIFYKINKARVKQINKFVTKLLGKT